MAYVCLLTPSAWSTKGGTYLADGYYNLVEKEKINETMFVFGLLSDCNFPTALYVNAASQGISRQ